MQELDQITKEIQAEIEAHDNQNTTALEKKLVFYSTKKNDLSQAFLNGDYKALKKQDKYQHVKAKVGSLNANTPIQINSFAKLSV